MDANYLRLKKIDDTYVIGFRPVVFYRVMYFYVNMLISIHTLYIK